MQGISGAPKGIIPGSAPTAREETTGPGGAGGLLNTEKDAKEASTDAKFSDVWKSVQARYGAKPEKPREIKKSLGKDDFMRIMMTQMKNQDPTNPFKADQFATQMAQFTSVEQLSNLNQQMAKMTTQNQPLERLAMTNMIGKSVTIDRERFVHTENTATTLQYELGRDAKDVQVTIKSGETGETVAVKDIGPAKSGLQSFVWDGGKDTGGPSKTGNYLFKVEAKDQGGRMIAMQTQGQASVVGVSFEGNEAVLLVGDNANPQKVTLKNVIRVDSPAENLIPGARSLAAASAGSAGAAAAGGQPPSAKPNSIGGSNFFTFEKGKGSVPIDPGSLSPEQVQALERYQSQRAAAMSAPAEAAEGAGAEAGAAGAAESGSGFPSGFSAEGSGDPINAPSASAAESETPGSPESEQS